MSEPADFDGIKYREETGLPRIFKLLLGALVAWGVCFTGYYLFSGWSSEGEFAALKQARSSSPKAVETASVAPLSVQQKLPDAAALSAVGKKAFDERCAACHGADARGGIGPDLSRKEYKYGKTVQAVTLSIREGRPGGMPPYGKDLSAEKIEGLVKYLLSL